MHLLLTKIGCLLIFKCLVIVYSYGQNHPCKISIKGQVFAIDTQEPLPFATIKILKSNLGTITNEKGEFIIDNICENEIDIEIRFLGYKTFVHHHDAHHTDPKIYLAPDQTILQSVVIEETRDNINLKSIVTQKKHFDILETINENTGEIMENIVGVSSLKTGQNISKPIVHGLHSNRVLIINNGVRHLSQSWDREQAPEINPTDIKRLTLVKGAGTIRYGPEALGGVILVDTNPLIFDSPLLINVSSGFQSNGKQIASKVDLSKGFKHVTVNSGIYGIKQGDLKSPNYFLTNTGKEEHGIHFSTKIHRPIYDIEVYGSHFNQQLGILRSSIFGNLDDLVKAINNDTPQITDNQGYKIKNPHQKSIHGLLKTSISFFLNHHELKIQYAYQKNWRREFDIRRGTNNIIPAINLKLFSHLIDVDWKYQSKKLESHYGFQLTYQDNNHIPKTNTIPFIPNFNSNNLGVFTIQNLQKGATIFELGIRYDYQYINARGRDSYNDIFRNTLRYHNFTFSAGINHEINEKLKVRTNIGTAWRPPQVNELYSFGKHTFNYEYGLWRYQLNKNEISTSQVIDNNIKKIKSERGIKWIGSLELSTPSTQLEMIGYVNFIKNYFFTRPAGITNTIRGSFPYFIYDQTDAMYIGIDISHRLQLKKDLISTIDLAYVYAKDIVNKQFFVEIPPFNINHNITQKIKNFTFSLTNQWTAKQWLAPKDVDLYQLIDNTHFLNEQKIFDLTPPTKGFFLVHFSLGYELNRVSFLLKMKNIFNHSYRIYTDRLRYFADNSGRNISFSINCFF